MLSGGGTGGHIYPAVAIADELKRRHPDAEFLFVGARDRMEMEKVPQAGYEIRGLWISGLARKLSVKNLLFPLKLIKSMYQARAIIKEFKPDLVVGTGGFASGPTLRMAGSMKIPYVLQEQNSFAGITNKWLAKGAQKIFVAYEGMEQFFPADRIQLSGNPVRGTLSGSLPDSKQAREHFGLDPETTTLLIIGGSLGARRINQLIASRLEFFREQKVQLLWQCGKGYYKKYKDHDSGKTSDSAPSPVRVRPFIAEMEQAYAAADLIISRAGAGSVSELCLIGKPVLFIPSPNVAEDHQTKNAQALASKDAALLLKETELEEKFDAVFTDLLAYETGRQEMGARMKALAKPMATATIVDELENILQSA